MQSNRLLLVGLRGLSHRPLPTSSHSLVFRSLHTIPPFRHQVLPRSLIAAHRSPILLQCRHLFGGIFSAQPKPKRFTLSPETLAAIGSKEAAANNNPLSIENELELLQAYADLDHEEGWNLIIARWERMAEFNPASPVLRSDTAFALYLHALTQTGKHASVAPATTRRDSLLAQHSIAAQATPAESAAAIPESADSASPKVSPPPATESLSSASATAQASAPSASPSTGVPLTNSERIAQSVLSGEKPHIPSAEAGTTGSAAPSAAKLLGNASGGGGDAPIHVVVNEPKGAWKGKLLRSVALTVVGVFFFVTFLSYLLEGSGFTRNEKGPNEFEPSKDMKPVKFADVHGCDEAKDELQDIVMYLKDPTSFTSLGGKLPKGVLLTGPPGTGKTMLARAIAGEAGVPFLFASASEFEEMYVGVGAKRVRSLFEEARKRGTAIIFIDEIDAVGGRRRSDDRNYLKQTLNQLLVEMDGFQQTDNIIVVAATNFPESLDNALTRPGRFDRHIAVTLPDIKGRAQIAAQYLKNIIHSSKVDPEVIARSTPGFSGADIENMINQAAIYATKLRSKEVTPEHFDWARDRIVMGMERKNLSMDPKVKELTAYHEGGHALVAIYTDGAMPLHKVTCIPRGHALGYTSQLPQGDRVSSSLREYRARIDVFLGGRVAEELIYGHDQVTSGCSSDLDGATSVATAMVKNYGYSDVIGRVQLKDGTMSQHARTVLESEVKRIIGESEERVVKLLTERKEELRLLAEALLEHEILGEEQVKKVIRGEKLPRISDVIKDAIDPPSDPVPTPSPAPKPAPTPAPHPAPGRVPTPAKPVSSSTQDR